MRIKTIVSCVVASMLIGIPILAQHEGDRRAAPQNERRSAPPREIYRAPKPTKKAKDILLIVRRSGGRAENGEYYSEFVVRKNGSCASMGNMGKKAGKLTQEEKNKLLSAIKSTNFKAIKAKKYRGMKPSAADGTDIDYIIATPRGFQELANYKQVLDSELPLFKVIDEIEGNYAGDDK